MENYNMEDFGEEIKNIRRSLKMTQRSVRERVGISENTLMKIEKGLVIPKYETLELLSLAYKLDLTAIFHKYRYDRSLETILGKIDEAIVNNRPDKLEECYELYLAYLNNNKNTANSPDWELLDCFLINAIKYYRHDLKDFQSREMIQNIRETMQRVNPELRWAHLSKTIFNMWEVRLLILLALLEASLDHYDISINILESIYGRFLKLRNQVVREQKVFLIALFNLSYHYHVTDQNEKALDIATQGIDYGREVSDFTLLHGLYYRQGIARYKLGMDNYMESLRYAVTMLEIMDRKKLAQLYRSVTLKSYDIEIQ
ncbi:MAG: helix-turn-helix transcriptional regulator [Clostridium sp.]|nr:helix-turn-helix transcriptional regulator [Clostridium sp.]